MAHARDRQRLLAEIRGDTPLPAVDAMDEAELGALADAVRKARRHQRVQLERALTEALGHLPALLRGPVRRILFP
jgi:hypothetical protein